MTGRLHPLRQEPGWEGDWQEVARREGDGLDITLLWSGSAERVKSPSSTKDSTPFSKSTSTAQMLLSAFEHPFAFIATGETVRSRQPLQEQTV